MRQVLSALENVETGFPAVSIPGNAGLHSEVGTSQEQQQIALEQQDVALDRIEKAAQRVGALGLEIHREIGVRPAPLPLHTTGSTSSLPLCYSTLCNT